MRDKDGSGGVCRSGIHERVCLRPSGRACETEDLEQEEQEHGLDPLLSEVVTVAPSDAFEAGRELSFCEDHGGVG